MSKQRLIIYLLLFLGSSILLSCGTSSQYYADQYSGPVSEDSLDKKEIDYSIYLIGDAGLPNLTGEDKTLSTLTAHLQQSGSNSSTVFLGDNIYENGMPADTSGEERKIAEQKIIKSLQTLTDYPGKAFFLSGNHDWRIGKERVLAQETFIEQYPDIEAEYIPSNGCPGPVSTNLSEDWLLIAIDSEWWINQSLKANVTEDGCKHQSREEVINATKEIINVNSQRNLLVTFHHPLYSSGSHGGYFSLKDHLFPLTNLKKWLYLPLPVIGSTYPIYRKLGLSRQDIRNNHYQQFKEQILDATEDAENLFFASGHEHSLELFEKKNHFAIVSGSASKISYARRDQGSEFTYRQHGFARLTSYKDGSIYVEFWVPEKGQEKGKLVYQKELIQADSSGTPTTSTDDVRENVTQETVTVAAGPNYEAGSLKRFIWGDHYRDAWTTPIEVPTIDLKTKRGGLEVLNVGGGQQSVSIIVQDTAGQKYIMRSVQKDPSKALPKELRETFASDILQDQISASHPYGDLIIPPMAEAADIYHTSSELVFVTEEAGLEFTDDSEGAFVFFEEFANETWFSRTYSKQAEDVLDTDQLWQKLRNENRNQVNEKQLLRTRLFDMFLGDWDRHDGQWFWAEHNTSDETIFEPIPIDRDNAFFKSDGLIPSIASRKWALRKFQHFDEDIRDIAGINLNAKDLDRWFLTKLSKDEWLNVAHDMEQSLTNETIENAVQQWPEPIYELNGNTVIRKLKARKDKITEFAERYYEILSNEVNVFGSDNRELFLIERKENGQTQVSVFDLNNEGKKGNRIYKRIFHPEETEEVRLYGFGGDDRFEVGGKSKEKITIRIIGGKGMDIIDDESQGNSEKKLAEVYDTKSGSVIENSGPIENKTSEDTRVNQFEKESFQYDYLGPLITGGYNSDDGLFLGGGAIIKTHGFRKDPFASMHQIKGKHSTLTSAFSFDYKGIFTDAIGSSYDLNLDLNVRAPNFKSNYFGLGNETEKMNDSKTFYRFRFDQILFSTALEKDISDITSFQVGSGYRIYEASSTPGRFISSTPAGLNTSDFKAHHYLSLNSAFNISATDNEVFPKYGIKVNMEADLNIGLNSSSETFGKLKSEASLYYTLDDFPATFAFRAGVSTNIGNYAFFQANTLGGNTLLGEPGNLRGFLRDRFAGRTSFFQNVEIRTQLFNFQSYLFPADVGVLGFFDNGRVWTNNENSDLWHQGYGGGVWISPFNRVVITTTYSLSTEDRLFSINLGFGF